jgi:hypothetical protein
VPLYEPEPYQPPETAQNIPYDSLRTHEPASRYDEAIRAYTEHQPYDPPRAQEPTSPYEPPHTQGPTSPYDSPLSQNPTFPYNEPTAAYIQNQQSEPALSVISVMTHTPTLPDPPQMPLPDPLQIPIRHSVSFASFNSSARHDETPQFEPMHYSASPPPVGCEGCKERFHSGIRYPNGE